MKKLTKKMGSQIASLINGLECSRLMMEQKDKDGNHKYDTGMWMAAYNRDARELNKLGIAVKLYTKIETGEEY